MGTRGRHQSDRQRHTRDYTILVPDDADRRIETTGLRASWYEGNRALTALWLPESRPNRVPMPAPPPGARVRERYDRWPGETWGFRAEHTGARSMVGVVCPGARPAADAAMNAGRYGLRAEAAYMGTEDDRGHDPFAKNHNIFVVLGADRTYGERLNVNVQYLSRYVRHFSPTGFDSGLAFQGAILNSQVARVEHGATARVKHSWHNETLVAELASTTVVRPVRDCPASQGLVRDH